MSLAVPNVALGQSQGRALLAERVDGLVVDVDGQTYTLRCYSQQPSSPSPLDAFITWDHTEWVNACARRITWNVYVILPQTYPLTIDIADVVAEQVGDAVYPVGRIQRAEPVSLALDNNQPPAPAVRVTIQI
jgi:hypothetical protein